MKTYIYPIITIYPVEMSSPIMYSKHDEKPDPDEGQFAASSFFDEEVGLPQNGQCGASSLWED